MLRRFQKLLTGCVVGLLGICLAGLIAQEPPGDPWEVKRVTTTKEKLSEEVGKGLVLVKMPLSDFDELLNKARQATQKNKFVPRLMRSAYTATLVGNSLVGSGEWSVHHPGTTGPAMMPLPSMNLALSKARNVTDPGPAILSDDGKNVGLLVLKPGLQTFAFDWSFRGLQSPGGLRFELRLPACPLGSLELELPRGMVVSVPPTAGLVTEAESKDPSKSLWQLNLTGKTQVDLDVRRLAGNAADGTEARLVQVSSVQEILADRVKADFDFQIDVLHHPVRKLVFDYDPLLKPFEVVLAADGKRPEQQPAEILKWGIDNKSLAVELREPFQGVLAALQVRCLAQRQPGQAWTSPFMRLRGALTRGEKLKLIAHPEVTLPNWNAGGFHLLANDRAADGSLALSLEDPRTLDTRGGPPPQRRPSFAGKSPSVDLHTRQQTWWHIGPQGMSLDADVSFEMARGSLYQLQMRLPKLGKTWRVEKVAVSPPEMMQSWSRTDQLLTVDLRSPVTPRTRAELKVELHSPADKRTFLEFPDLEPYHAAVREGTYNIDVDPSFQASVTEHKLPAVSVDSDGYPAGRGTPAFSFRFRDQVVNPQPFMPVAVAGKLRLVPSSDRLQSFTRTKVMLAAGHATVQTRLELEPLRGSLEQCDLLFAHGSKAPWQVRFEKASGRMLRLEPRPLEERLPLLLGLGSASPLGWLPAMGTLEDMQVRRLRFSPPLTQRETIVLETACTSLGDHWWDVPLFSVMDTPQRQGEVLLQPSGTVLGRVLAHGLVLPARDHQTALDLRRLPLEPAMLPSLRLQASPAEAVLSRQEHIDHARLQNYLLEDGRVFHHFSFQAANWPAKDISVVLPARANVLGAKVAGLWQDDVPMQPGGRGDGVEIRLPVPPGWGVPLSLAPRGDLRSQRDAGGPWQFDVFYLSEPAGSTWSIATHYDAPWPTLPIVPLTRQRSWHLAPGQAPLRQDLWRDAMVPAGMAPPGQEMVRKAWQIGQPLLESFAVRPNEDNRQLRDAELDLRKQWAGYLAAGNFTLGRALERLISDRTAIVLAVDAPALQAAGLGPDTPLGKLPVSNDQPFWENLGLTTVSCPSGIVLTTRRPLDGQAIPAPKDLDSAVAQAVVYGRDRFGVLQLATTWLRSGLDPAETVDFSMLDGTETPSARTVPAGLDAFPHGLFVGQPPVGWTVWEPRTSLEDEPVFDVVRTDDLRHLTYVIALATLVLSWRTRRALSGVVFFRVLLVWTVGWGLTYIWLPASLQVVALGPLLTSWAFALLAYLLMLARGVPAVVRHGLSTRTMIKGTGSSITPIVLLLLACLPLLSAQNAPLGKAEPPIVRIVPADASEKTVAYAYINLEFNKRLDDAVSPTKPATLVAAEYQGRVESNVFVFEATFDLFSMSEKSKLVLPLSGIALKGEATIAALDANGVGGKELPVSISGKDGQYAVSVMGQGFHRLRFSFIAQNQGSFQELRCDIPRLAQSRLRLLLPAGWRDVQLPHCQGAVQIRKAPGERQEIEAQLGRENTLHVRWTADASAPVPPSLEVRELYLWDLRPAHFAITGLLHYNITKGAVSHLQIYLPENIDIQSVELGSPATPGARILQWRLDGQRHLHVDLASPATGKLSLVLNLVPRLALDAPLELGLPLPQSGARPVEGALAYRLEGWDSTETQTQGLIPNRLPPEEFARKWKEAAGQRDPGPITRAWSFRRELGFAPQQVQLRPKLQPIRPALRQETLCQVHPAYTDVTVRIHAQGSAAAPITLLRCAVPPAMVLAGVTGKDVHHWSRTDAIVQIWLLSDRPSAPVIDAHVTLTGWVKNVQAQDGEEMGRFFLPRIRLVSDQPGTVAAKVEAGAGCQVEPESYGPLWTSALGLMYDGTYQIRPNPAHPEVRSLTTAGIGNGVFSFSCRVDCRMLRDVPPPNNLKENHPIVLTLRDWPGDVRLDPLPADVTSSKHLKIGNDHVWKLYLRPKVLLSLSVQVHGQKTLTPLEEIKVPTLEVAQAGYRGRWLVWNGPDPKAKVEGLEPVKDLADVRRYWPAEHNRLPEGSVAWQVKGPAWQFEVTAPATSAPRVWKALWAEHEILNEEGRWLHQASWLLTTRTAAELNLVLPEGASFQAASWGDTFVNPRLDDARHLALQLPQSLTGQVLRVRWKFDSQENPTQPRAEAPTFPGSQEVPLSTILWLSADFALPSNPRPGGEVPLNRARGEMTLCKLLAESAAEQKTPTPETKGIRAAQLLFHELTRDAEYELTLAKNRLELERTDALLQVLKKLRAQNKEWAGKYGYEKIRAETEKTAAVRDAPHLALPRAGLPIYGYEGVSPLRPVGRSALGLAVFASQLLVVGFFALFFLSFLPRLFWALPSLWPEQLLTVGAVGTLLLGFSLVGAALVAAALLGRFLWLGRWIWRMTGRLFRQAAA